MAKWVAFLSGSEPPAVSDIVFSRKSLEEMWQPVITQGDSADLPPESIGYSFFLYPRGSGDAVVTRRKIERSRLSQQTPANPYHLARR